MKRIGTMKYLALYFVPMALALFFVLIFGLFFIHGNGATSTPAGAGEFPTIVIPGMDFIVTGSIVVSIVFSVINIFLTKRYINGSFSSNQNLPFVQNQEQNSTHHFIRNFVIFCIIFYIIAYYVYRVANGGFSISSGYGIGTPLFMIIYLLFLPLLIMFFKKYTISKKDIYLGILISFIASAAAIFIENIIENIFLPSGYDYLEFILENPLHFLLLESLIPFAFYMLPITTISLLKINKAKK